MVAEEKPVDYACSVIHDEIMDSAVDDVNANLERQRKVDRALGMVRGKHLTEWPVDIKLMLRQGRDDEALEILLECIDASESRLSYGVIQAPWHTDKSAAILHRRHDYVAEAALLRRYLDQTKYVMAPFRKRLARAEELIAARAMSGGPPACPVCGTVLDRWPSITVNCPGCSADLVSRVVLGNRTLFTKTSDALRADAAKYQKQRDAMLLRVGPLGIDAKTWDERGRRMINADVAEIYWDLMTELVHQAKADGNWLRSYTGYLDMARFRVEEGNSWIEYSRSADDLYCEGRLAHYDHTAELYFYGCSCAVCRADWGRMTVGAYLDERPAPHEHCERPPCHCRLNQPLLGIERLPAR